MNRSIHALLLAFGLVISVARAQPVVLDPSSPNSYGGAIRSERDLICRVVACSQLMDLAISSGTGADTARMRCPGLGENQPQLSIPSISFTERPMSGGSAVFHLDAVVGRRRMSLHRVFTSDERRGLRAGNVDEFYLSIPYVNQDGSPGGAENLPLVEVSCKRITNRTSRPPVFSRIRTGVVVTMGAGRQVERTPSEPETRALPSENGGSSGAQ